MENACAVFEGREQSTLELLQTRMERAAERLQFETAARLRDAIRHVRSVGGRQHALLSAVHDLSLVAVCAARRSEQLCLFVFRSGRLVLQEDLGVEELCRPGTRKSWARRLVKEAQPAARPPAAGEIDPALLDEIQIVTAWMKQKTRQGEYWRLPDGKRSEQAASLDAWLLGQARPVAEHLAA